MPQNNDETIKGWITKAHEALVETQFNLDHNLLAAAQNRLYYSLFYAAKALAAKKEINTSKHTELLGWFNKNYVKTSIVDKKTAVIYNKSFDNRNKSDYTISFVPDKETLIEDLSAAKHFIASIEQLLSEDK